MANLLIKDGADATKYLKSTGAGSDVDPYILERYVSSVTQGISVPVVLTVTNGAYTIGDVVGGLITFANAVRVSGGKSIVNSVKLSGVNALAYNLFFFNADLATPAADNAAFTTVVADNPKFLGHVPIVAGDYKAAASAFNYATVKNVGLQVQASATTIYAYLVAIAVTSPGTTRLDLTVDFNYLD